MEKAVSTHITRTSFFVVSADSFPEHDKSFAFRPQRRCKMMHQTLSGAAAHVRTEVSISFHSVPLAWKVHSHASGLLALQAHRVKAVGRPHSGRRQPLLCESKSRCSWAANASFSTKANLSAHEGVR